MINTDDRAAIQAAVEEERAAIHAAMEEERLRSPYRDRASGNRVHPYKHDFSKLREFVVDRRRSQPGATELVRRSHDVGDLEAVRLLVDMVLTKGRCNRTEKARCARILAHCDQIELAYVAHALVAAGGIR